MPDEVASPRAPRCQVCGGALAVTLGALRCSSCGTPASSGEGAVAPRHDLLAALGAAARGDLRDVSPDARSVACQGCGAVAVTIHRAVRCAFCAGALVVTDPGDSLVPDAVAPFAIAEEFARAQLERWLRRRWFAPTDLRRAAERDRLTSVFLPYWSFSLLARAVYVGERGDVSYSIERQVGRYGRVTQHRVRHVRWRCGNGHVRSALIDHPLPATASVPASLLASLGQRRAENLQPFSALYLHGHLAERYSVNLKDGFAQAERHLEAALYAQARRDLGGQEQRVHHLSTRYEDATFRQVLLPVWITAFRYGGRVHRVVIDGQTGRLAATRPYSAVKLGAAALALAAVVAAAAWLWHRAPAPEPQPASPLQLACAAPRAASDDGASRPNVAR